jgi:hypothetical protein
MKSMMILFVACLIAVGAMAQDERNNMEFLLDGRISVSAFGGPIVEFSGMNNDVAVSSGGGGALLLNKRFFIGGYGLSTSDDANLTNGNVRLGHGGFWLGMISNPQKMVHFGFTSKLGWGTASSRELGLTSTDNIFVLSPEAIAEFNITRWCKINAGAGYRLVTGFSNDSGLRSSDFSAPTFTLNFLFGWFGR